MQCRCVMCGIKNAGKLHRISYIRAGIKTSETFDKGSKRTGRKLRRVREKRQWKCEL